MRSWRSVADGPVNPKRVEVKNPERMAGIIKGVAKFLGADLVGICRLNPAWVFTHHGLRIDFHKGLAGKAIEVVRRQADGTWRFAIDDPYARG